MVREKIIVPGRKKSKVKPKCEHLTKTFKRWPWTATTRYKTKQTHVYSKKGGIHKFKVSQEHNMVDFEKQLAFYVAGLCIYGKY